MTVPKTASTSQISEIVHLNVSGTRFTVRKESLRRFPDTVLGRVCLYPDTYSDIYNDEDKEFFFDRNPKLMYDLIDYYKTGVMHLPSNMCSEVIKDDLDYWGVPESAIATCCWTAYNQKSVDIKMTYAILDLLEEVRKSNAYQPVTMREKIRMVIEYPFRSTATKIWNALYLLVVLLAVVVVSLSYHPDFRQVNHNGNGTPFHINFTLDPLAFYNHTFPIDALLYLDLICLVIFFLEVVLRIATSINPVQLFKNVLFILDIVLVLSYATILTERVSHIAIESKLAWSNFIHMVIPLRALKVLHFCQRMAINKLFQQRMKQNWQDLVTVSITTICTITVFGTVVFSVEQMFGTDLLKTLPDAMWWSLATVTTVGYGDVYPESVAGRLVAAIALVFGAILVSIPSAIILFNSTRADAIVYYMMKRVLP